MSKLLKTIFCTDRPMRDIKNANRVNLWALAWALSLVIISYASKHDFLVEPSLISIAFIIHVATGVTMILAYKRLLTGLDELERKIQLDALALSVGSTIVGFSSYSILAKTDILEPLSPSMLIMVMALTYMVGIIIGRVRYS